MSITSLSCFCISLYKEDDPRERKEVRYWWKVLLRCCRNVVKDFKQRKILRTCVCVYVCFKFTVKSQTPQKSETDYRVDWVSYPYTICGWYTSYDMLYRVFCVVFFRVLKGTRILVSASGWLNETIYTGIRRLGRDTGIVEKTSGGWLVESTV